MATKEATKAILSIWTENDIQSQLDGVARNSHIYEKIADDLGHTKTWKQCRTKVKNMTQRYRKVIAICLETVL